MNNELFIQIIILVDLIIMVLPVGPYIPGMMGLSSKFDLFLVQECTILPVPPNYIVYIVAYILFPSFLFDLLYTVIAGDRQSRYLFIP